MTPERRGVLANCNGMGLDGPNWVPMQKDGDKYRTPLGLLVLKPREWRDMTVDEIVTEMDRHNQVPRLSLSED